MFAIYYNIVHIIAIYIRTGYQIYIFFLYLLMLMKLLLIIIVKSELWNTFLGKTPNPYVMTGVRRRCRR